MLDAEVAADLLAETFAVAYERRRRFRDIGRPGGAWLYGIAAKELSHWFRGQEVEHRAALTAALGQMTGAGREAVQLRVVGELGYGEIAARLGCSEGAARTRVHRGLARLNTLMHAEATG